MGKRYNNILEIMGNTPVVKLNKLGPKGGPLVTAGQGGGHPLATLVNENHH